MKSIQKTLPEEENEKKKTPNKKIAVRDNPKLQVFVSFVYIFAVHGLQKCKYIFHSLFTNTRKK
jgi:hypothetical protein